MGMFDTLRIEQKIPGFTEIPDCEFQTKSFDNCMENYVITIKGELYRDVWDYKWIDDNEVPIIKGYMKKIEDSYRREYLTDFHGDIIFYEGKSVNGKWRDYVARFTEGKLTRIWYEDKQY
jgi:hypothetical protein